MSRKLESSAGNQVPETFRKKKQDQRQPHSVQQSLGPVDYGQGTGASRTSSSGSTLGLRDHRTRLALDTDPGLPLASVGEPGKQHPAVHGPHILTHRHTHTPSSPGTGNVHTHTDTHTHSPAREQEMLLPGPLWALLFWPPSETGNVSLLRFSSPPMMLCQQGISWTRVDYAAGQKKGTL